LKKLKQSDVGVFSLMLGHRRSLGSL